MLVYAENFRGFKRICLSLDKTIFLVGDNSSGKTSILHLVDLICSSDLNGTIKLNQNFHVSPTDFFSPYFNYEDVIVAFQVEQGRKAITRAVTLRRIPKYDAAIVTAVTYASSNTAIVLRDREDKFEYTHLKGDSFSLESIIEIHKNPPGEFTVIEDVPHGFALNDQAVAFSVISAIRANEKSATGADAVGHELIFSSAPTFRHFGPLRARPERFYQFDRRIRATGVHFATIMQDFATGPHKAKSNSAVRKFGKQSGLFDDIRVRRITNSVDGAPIAVFIRRNGKEFLINQVGIGVSQVAPIIAETQAVSHGMMNTQLFLIEQPELHLHPVAQAALGEYLWEMSTEKTRFIVETHSDFLIDRYRSKVRDKNGAGPAKIVYCHTESSGNEFVEIDIDDRGRLINPPKKYNEFFLNEYSRTMF